MKSIDIARLISEKLDNKNYEIIEAGVTRQEEIQGLEAAKKLVVLENSLKDLNPDTPYMDIIFESANADQKFDEKDLQKLAMSARAKLLAGID